MHLYFGPNGAIPYICNRPPLVSTKNAVNFCCAGTLFTTNFANALKSLQRSFPLHLPAELVQRLDMPEAFAGDGAEGQGAEEIHKKDFRDTELQSLLKGFQRPAAAPVVDGGQGVAGQGHHILYRDHIRVFAQQLFIVAVHLPQRVLRQLLGEPRHIVGAVPALRRRVEFWKNRPLLQVCFHILFSDFIAPGFLTRPLTGHLAAFEQVQRRGLADVAYSEKLLLVHYLGNAVPVNGEYIHL